MPTLAVDSDPIRARPVIIDIVRAYEGILFGLVVVILAAFLSGSGAGLAEFAAVLVLPAVLMVAFMHLGRPPRGLYVLRAAGALVGWALGWIVFIPLFIALSYAVFTAPAWPLVYVTIAVADGILLGLCVAAADRIGLRMRARASVGA